jgi:hypothetical protein
MLIADLRGLFFHIVSDSTSHRTTVPRVVFPWQPTNVGNKVVSANNVICNVICVGTGNNMNGSGNPGKYDVGVEIGTPGIGAVGNDIQTATITVAWSQLKISHLCYQRFGVRLNIIS